MYVFVGKKTYRVKISASQTAGHFHNISIQKGSVLMRWILLVSERRHSVFRWIVNYFA